MGWLAVTLVRCGVVGSYITRAELVLISALFVFLLGHVCDYLKRNLHNFKLDNTVFYCKRLSGSDIGSSISRRILFPFLLTAIVV